MIWPEWFKWPDSWNEVIQPVEKTGISEPKEFDNSLTEVANEKIKILSCSSKKMLISFIDLPFNKWLIFLTVTSNLEILFKSLFVGLFVIKALLIV